MANVQRLKFLSRGKIDPASEAAHPRSLGASVDTFGVRAGSKCNICQEFQKETIQAMFLGNDDNVITIIK